MIIRKNVMLSSLIESGCAIYEKNSYLGVSDAV
jgi:hypothetical protein